MNLSETFRIDVNMDFADDMGSGILIQASKKIEHKIQTKSRHIRSQRVYKILHARGGIPVVSAHLSTVQLSHQLFQCFCPIEFLTLCFRMAHVNVRAIGTISGAAWFVLVFWHAF